MRDYKEISLRAFYRAESHLPIWEVLEQSGIWSQLAMKVEFEFCDSSSVAEKALFDGEVDFVSGNHISPYGLVARGKPIVCLASPSNRVHDRLVTREPMASLAAIRGKRIGDTTVLDPGGGYHHPRGNHMLYVMRAGLALEEVEWVELADTMEEFRSAHFEALHSGAVDAIFITGDTEKYREAGLHVMELDPLPMVNGPTLTTNLDTLKRKDRLGERLVKAMLLGIHFVRTRREETERILENLKQRIPSLRSASYGKLAGMPKRPYPDPHAIINAYKLCCMKVPETAAISPLALWDLHDLRELDQSGFIDRLYS